MDQEITVRYREDAIDVDIDDLTGHYLQRHFKLTFEPATLVYHKPNGNRKLVDIAKQDKFQAGNTYYLEEEPQPAAVPQKSASWVPSNLVSSLTIDSSEKQNLTSEGKDVWKDMQEVVTNSIICSQASYAATDAECVKYFKEEIEKHSLCDVTINQHAGCHFVMAEEDPHVSSGHTKRVYIAFRGTTLSASDLAANLKFYQVENVFWERNNGQVLKGKVHAGFLEKASQFPTETILSDKDLKDKEIILCGHSLGGAIATIVAVNMIVAATKRYEATRQGGDSVRRVIKCVTFGAPMVGDSAFRELCDSLGVSQNLFNLVNGEDPIPKILSFAQGISASANMLDQQIRSRVSDNPDKDSCYDTDRKQWIEQKDSYKILLAKTMDACNVTLDAAAVLFPNHSKSLNAMKLGASLIREIIGTSSTASKTSRGKQLTYDHVGNYFFHTPADGIFKLLHFQNTEAITDGFEDCLRGVLLHEADGEVPAYHSCNCYEDVVKVWSVGPGGTLKKYGKDKFLPVTPEMADFQGFEEVFVERCVARRERYKPMVTGGEVTYSHTEDEHFLRMTVRGHNIYHVIEKKCDLGTGLLFQDQQVNVKRRRMCLSSNEDKLSFEQVVDKEAAAPTMGDMGVTLKLRTAFGECAFRLHKGHMRNLKVESVNQLCYESSTSVLIQRAIQRGMAVSQIKGKMQRQTKKGPAAMDEGLIKTVLGLSSKLLGAERSKKLAETFDEADKKIQFMLSNKKEFEKIQDICVQMEKSVTEPLKLTMEKSLAKKVFIGAAAVIGGGTVAYIAGPYLVYIGLVEAVAGMVGGTAAGSLTGLGTGWVLGKMLTTSPVDEQYNKVLVYLITQLYQKHKAAKSSPAKLESPSQEIKCIEYFPEGTNLLRDVDDLVEQGTTYSLEKALLLLYDKKSGFNNFKDSDLAECTKESKESLVKRIECAELIHNIRKTLAQQCYIGVVGTQDAGNLVYINKMKLFSCYEN